ncbi:phage tail tape measure protein [Piscinibacter sp.]|uniref:phage tail tape measure protein n=1 Tax=Piscinibacter sp. TaxID=1903157 RepID=UPI002C762180|nr:phage tail tape measure protein [Albitalea sp.]HUG26213.1 phage tail tape measure protein [Albitalea sp.]
MALGQLTIDLLLKTGSFETDTKRAEKRLRDMGREMQTIGKVIGGAFAAVGGASVLLVKSAIDTADAAGKSAAAAGLAVEQYSALAYAAELSGVETAALGTSLSILNKNIASNDDAFKTLGISVNTATGQFKDSDQVLSELADRFADMPDGARKSQLALELFGRSGAQLIPLLNQGSAGIKQLKDEAARLGVVVTGETSKAAEQFNDDMTRLQKTISGVGLALAKDFLPVLTDLSTRTLKNAEDFGTLRGGFMALYEVILGGIEPADLLEKQNKQTAESIKGLRAEIDLLTMRGASEGFQGGVLGQLRDELATLEAQAKGSSQRLADALNEAAGRTGREGRGAGFKDPRISTSAPGAPDKPEKSKTTDAERYLENLRKQIEATQNLTTVEQLLSDIQAGRLGKITAAQKDELSDLARQIDAHNALTEAIAGETAAREGALAIAQSAEAALAAEAASIMGTNQALRDEIEILGGGEKARRAIEQARLSSAIALREEQLAMEKNAGASEAQVASLEQQIRLLRELAELLGRRDAVTDFVAGQDEMQEAAKRTNAELKSVLGDTLLDGLTGDFEGIEDRFKRMLLQMAADAAAAQLVKAITGSGLFGSANAFGGSTSAGFGTGAGYGNMDLGGFLADGGPATSGKAYVVGERGPELFLPTTSGRVLPNEALGGGRGGMVDVQVINNGAPARGRAEQSQQPDGRTLVKIFLDAVAEDVDSGTGKVSSSLKRRGVNLNGSLARRA